MANLIEDHRRSLEKIKPEKKKPNYMFYVLLLIAILVLCVPYVVFFMLDSESVPESVHTCSVDFEFRVPCGYNISSSDCTEVGCCYDNALCYHYYPSKYNYNPSGSGYIASEVRTPYGYRSIDRIVISVSEINKNKLQITLHEPTVKIEEKKVSDSAYSTEFNPNYLAISVKSTANGKTILNTAHGALIASERYWEWSIHLTDHQLFGLGQLLLNESTTLTKVIYKNENDHTTLPIFLAHQEGHWHGLKIEHGYGPLEISILSSNLIIIRSLAGNIITLNLYTGLELKDLTRTMRSSEYVRPERWLFGSHLCTGAQVPLDDLLASNSPRMSPYKYNSDCLHEYLLLDVFKADQAKRERIKEEIDFNIRGKNKKFFLAIPPQIPMGNSTIYTAAMAKNVLFRPTTNSLHNGTFMNEKVVFLNLHSVNIMKWIEEDLKKEILSVVAEEDISGLIFIDGWPAEITYQMEANKSEFSYLSEDIKIAMSKTLPWNLTSFDETNLHYEEHNNYGYDYMNLILEAFPNVKFTMLSSYRESEHTAYLQNINITWTDLKRTISTSLYHSLLVHPIVSSPICGSTFFYDSKQEENCIRWYITAATLPIFMASQDWPEIANEVQTGFGKEVVLQAIKFREMFADYYYGAISDEPLIRPMFYEFYKDNNTWALDEQYMVGDAILVAQLLLGDSNILKVYLPKDVEWYEFWGGKKESGWIRLHIVQKDWVTYIKGGSIVPLIKDDSYTFAIALHCETLEDCSASGKLELDSGVLSLSSTITTFTISDVPIDFCTAENQLDARSITKLQVYGAIANSVCYETLDIDLCAAPPINTFEYKNCIFTSPRDK